MVWFHRLDRLADYSNVEVRGMTETDILFEEVDCPKIDGYINLHRRDDGCYLVRTDGLYRFDEPSLKFVLIDPERRIEHRDQLLYSVGGHYLRLPIETPKTLRSIYYRFGKSKVIYQLKNYPFEIDRFRIAKGRYYYYLKSEAVGLQMLEYVDHCWIESELTGPEFRKLPIALPIDDAVFSEIVGFEISDYAPVLPGEWYYKEKRRIKRSLVDRFGGVMVAKHGFPLERSKNLLDWEEVADLADCHRGIFDGEITEPWSLQPMFDTSPSIVYTDDVGYSFYNRANIGENCRYIQRSTSRDLKRWSEYEPITTPNFDFQSGSNYYTPAISLHRDGQTRICLSSLITQPTSETTRVEEQLLISDDGLDFEQLVSWRTREYPESDLHDVSTMLLPIAGTFHYTDRRTEWFAFEIGPFGKIFRLSTRLDGFSSIGSSGSGRLRTRFSDFETTLHLNYRVGENGRIRFNFFDEFGEPASTTGWLSDDQTRFAFDPTVASGSIETVFENAELYTIEGVTVRPPALPRYQTISYYYRRMYDRTLGRWLYGRQVSSYRRHRLELPDSIGIERILGRSISTAGSAVLSLRLRLTDGHEIEIELENSLNQSRDQLRNSRLFPKALRFGRGAPGAVYHLRLEADDDDS